MSISLCLTFYSYQYTFPHKQHVSTVRDPGSRVTSSIVCFSHSTPLDMNAPRSYHAWQGRASQYLKFHKVAVKVGDDARCFDKAQARRTKRRPCLTFKQVGPYRGDTSQVTRHFHLLNEEEPCTQGYHRTSTVFSVISRHVGLVSKRRSTSITNYATTLHAYLAVLSSGMKACIQGPRHGPIAGFIVPNTYYSILS